MSICYGPIGQSLDYLLLATVCQTVSYLHIDAAKVEPWDKCGILVDGCDNLFSVTASIE